ncbi:MAG TPA: SDR family NAD(P)-dependent oxidoreductase [Spirochaetia bacterium]|nr:SDR family NAD(P)-dependent oxidoreductase [Spirochaetia bacterium]
MHFPNASPGSFSAAKIAVAALRIRTELGRLDLLVQNAAISNTRKGGLSLKEYREISLASNVPLDEVRAVWETNVFGVLAVYQAMLPLLRESSDARIVSGSSGVGSLTLNADPAGPYHKSFSPVYSASKAALNAITLSMMVELESTGIEVALDDEVLNEIDQIVPPGTDIGSDAANYVPPALSQVNLRRRPVNERAAA